MSSALRDQYVKVAAELKESWGKSNLFEVPRLDKIVINVGMGLAKEDSGYRDLVVESLKLITGQQPVVTKARASIAGFKLREEMEIGAKVTLRGQRKEDFFYRLVHIVMPRIRDFRGVSKKGFDGHGNYTLGLREHTVFPEIPVDDVSRTHPLQVTITTTTDSDEEAFVLLKRLGFPFIEDLPGATKEQDGA